MQRRHYVDVEATFLNGIYPVGFNPGRFCRVSAQVGCYGRVYSVTVAALGFFIFMFCSVVSIG